MSYLDTRDLETEREDLKQQVLESFLESFPHYEDMTDNFEDIRFEEEEIQNWKEDWLDEIVNITDIEKLEDEVGSEFSYGVTLFGEYDFEDYCRELVEDVGDLSKDLPSYISNNIDWLGVANDLRVDYTEVEFRAETYLFR
jgi:hypothetical protein